jgi:PilZ domain
VTTPVKPKRKRGSKRVILSVTLIASAKLQGSLVQFKAETVNVNREGAKIRTPVTLEVGLRIRVAVLEPYRFAHAKVMWANPNAREYGVELENPGNFWGICFPPDDWQEPSLLPGGKIGERRRILGGTLDENGKVANKPYEAAAIGGPTIPAEGKSAILTGMSAIGLPFQEAGTLTPDGEEGITMLVRPSVTPGVPLRVVMDSQVFRANIKSVSRHREGGKWRVWLRFS